MISQKKKFETLPEGKRPNIANARLTKNKAEGLALPDLQTYCKATNKTVRHWQENRDREQ